MTSAPSEINNPYQFASGYFDASTGYLKFGERYDDPTQDRWMQQDPVATPRVLYSWEARHP